MTIREALKEAGRRLDAAGVPDARVDARLLLAQVLACPPLDLLAAPDRPLPAPEQAQFSDLLARRLAREPLQYILGQADFMGHSFLTAPGVLIPRQDTEALCQHAIALTAPHSRVLDLCCGSGCLAISLKLARPEALVYAGDIAPEALDLSQENAARLGAAVDVRQGDLFVPFDGLCFDLILSNPPYIPTGELHSLQAEVRREPALALDGGPDGLAFYRRILAQAPRYLALGGSLLLELGDQQAEAVAALVPAGFESPRIHKDLGGLPRVLETRHLGGVK